MQKRWTGANLRQHDLPDDIAQPLALSSWYTPPCLSDLLLVQYAACCPSVYDTAYDGRGKFRVSLYRDDLRLFGILIVPDHRMVLVLLGLEQDVKVGRSLKDVVAVHLLHILPLARKDSSNLPLDHPKSFSLPR